MHRHFPFNVTSDRYSPLSLHLVTPKYCPGGKGESLALGSAAFVGETRPISRTAAQTTNCVKSHINRRTCRGIENQVHSRLRSIAFGSVICALFRAFSEGGGEAAGEREVGEGAEEGSGSALTGTGPNRRTFCGKGFQSLTEGK